MNAFANRGIRALWVALATVAVASVALIAISAVRVHSLQSAGAVRNHAVTDRAETNAVLKSANAAMTKLWSYDYRDLSATRTDAAELGTGGFVRQYAAVFADIDRLAPQTQAVVTATVTQSAVQRLHGDRASVIVFLDQHATKHASGQNTSAGARLKVLMQRTRGTWKVASVTPF